jgi:hypothetical protein
VVFTAQNALLTESLKSELDDWKNYVQIVALKSKLIHKKQKNNNLEELTWFIAKNLNFVFCS